MKNMVSILAMVCALLLVITTVGALSVSGASYSSMCQCDTIKNKYSVCATESGIYNVSIQGEASKWISAAPSSLSIEAGKCADVYLFITPECYANSKTYNANLLVTGPEDENKTLQINLEQCHTFDFDVSPSHNTSKPCEENVYNVSVKNTGKFTDEFVFIQEGLPNGWATYPQDKFILNPYQSYSTQVKVKSSCNSNAGDYNFLFSLSNTRTNNSSTKKLLQTITSYVPFELGWFFPASGTYTEKLCEEYDKNIYLTAINNSDRNDELIVTLLDVNYNALSNSVAYLDKTNIKLDINVPVVVELSILRHTPQTIPMIIKVHSKNYESDYFAQINLVFEDCYNLVIERVSTNSSACLGKTEQKFLVRNFGTQDVDANVMLLDGTLVLDQVEITVDSNQSETAKLYWNPTSAGDVTPTAMVRAAYTEEGVSYPFSFENCYETYMAVGNNGVCKKADAKIAVEIINNGTRTQEFEVTTNSSWLDVKPSTVTVNQNETKTVYLKGEVPNNFDNNFTVIATSNDITMSKTVNLFELTKDQCNDVGFEEPTQVVDINCCSGTVVGLVVKNTGYFDQTVTVDKEMPVWVSFSENEFDLGVGEEKTAYLYFAPPAGTNGYFVGRILIENDNNVRKTVDYNLRVFGGNCGIVSGADINVNNKLAQTKVYTRKEVTIDFVVTNDSNIGFNVNNVTVEDLNATVDFNKGTFLMPGEYLVAKLTAKFAEGEEPVDRNVTVLVETSAGSFQKTQMVSFSNEEPQGLAITGWFSAYAVPIMGILFLVLIVLVILALGSTNAKKPKTKK